MSRKAIYALAFVVRCSGAATTAYELAGILGLPESVWAAMSAVIVSQEQLHETKSLLAGRILGTLIGIAITVSVSGIASRMAAPTAVQMAVAVALSALISREFPKLRVAMWTCPVILLSAPPSVPIISVALGRGGEVILGAILGWAFHWAAEFLVDIITGAAHQRHGARDQQGRSGSHRGLQRLGGRLP